MRRAGHLALALLTAAGWAGAAGAQEVPQVVSPLRVETDHNNVNLVSGKTTIEGPVLQVPAAPNLRFDRVQNAAPYVRGTIQGPPGGPADVSYSVHAGGAASESFRCPDLDCASVTGTGSTFQPSQSGRGPAIYRQAGSGARYAFTVLHVSTIGPPPSMYYYASSVTWPNGETIAYSYDTASLPDFPAMPFRRPNRLQSNLGYHITISYHPGELGTIEWNSPLQATLYADAAPTVPLQRLTYALHSGTITDIGGRVWSCANCRNSMGAEIEVGEGSLQLPGEQSPALQVTRLPPPPGMLGVQLVSSVTRDGVGWTYAYTNLGGVPGNSSAATFDRLTVTGPNGFNQVYEFNQLEFRNVLESMTDSLGRTSSYTFDTAYRPTRIVYPEGNEVSVLYDPQGNVVERRAKARPGTGLADIVQTAQYPDAPGGIPNACHVACWRPLSSRDALNRQTDYTYNADGQLTQQDEPADASGVRRRTIVEYALSPNGQIARRAVVRVCGAHPTNPALTTCGTAQEHRTEYLYLGDTPLVTRERRVDLGTGAVLDTVNGYDAQGRLVSTDGPLPGTADATYARYDVHGRRTWEIGAADPAGVRLATRSQYRDSDDKLVSAERGTIPDSDSSSLTVLNRTDLAYDSRRNPERETLFADGIAYTLTQRSFDLSNRLVCEARRMYPPQVPADACVPGVEGPTGPDRIARNVWDAAGQRLQLREGVGSAVEGAEASWAYNLNGQVAIVIDGNGNRAELRYDGHMRQDRWTFPSTTRPASYNDANQTTALATAGAANPADYEQYGYDANGNRTSLRKRDGSILTYSYDNLNRMILKVVPERAGLDPIHTRDVHYGYDLRNLQTFARFDSAAGEGVTNVYDGFGRLESSTINLGGVSRDFTYQYREDGARTRIRHPDGAAFGWAYNARAQLTELRDDPAGRNDMLASMNYDPFARPTILTRGTGVTITTFDYYPTNWLWLLNHNLSGGPANDLLLAFSHNRAGQIREAYRDNDLYAWQGHYQANRAYTANGLNQYTAAGSATLSYDPNGNLASDGTDSYTYDVENRLVTASGGVTLRYDPLGRLHQVTSASGATTFLYDGDALTVEYDAAGNVLRRYVHGAEAADHPLIWYEGPDLSVYRHLLADERGSIVAMADSGGNLIAANRYDEYGIPAATNVGRFQYTGQIWLPELGMYYYKNRIYSPTLGRFLQTDPIGYDDQFNLYAYVGNDPVNMTDPSGKSGCGTRAPGGDSASCPDRGNPRGVIIQTRITKVEGRPGSAAFRQNLRGIASSESGRLARESATRTERGNYQAEYGYTVHFDRRTREVVSRLVEGELGGVSLPLRDGNRPLLVSGHAHTGIAGYFSVLDLPSRIFGTAPDRRLVTPGASQDDKRNRDQFPGVPFFVMQQRYLGGSSVSGWQVVQY